MFQGMGQAGLARRLIAGANPVPELGMHHGGAVVFVDDDPEAVVQGEPVSGGFAAGQGRQRLQHKAESQPGEGVFHGRCPDE